MTDISEDRIAISVMCGRDTNRGHQACRFRFARGDDETLILLPDISDFVGAGIRAAAKEKRWKLDEKSDAYRTFVQRQPDLEPADWDAARRARIPNGVTCDASDNAMAFTFRFEGEQSRIIALHSVSALILLTYLDQGRDRTDN